MTTNGLHSALEWMALLVCSDTCSGEYPSWIDCLHCLPACMPRSTSVHGQSCVKLQLSNVGQTNRGTVINGSCDLHVHVYIYHDST